MKKHFLPLLSLVALLFLTACATGEVSATPHELGNPNAKVLIEEFADLQCPACAAISPQVEAFVKEYPDLARMRYYHFPLTQHQHAFAAAEAAECAGDQGRFWEYVESVFDNQSNLSEDLLYSIARGLELNEERFTTCLEDHENRAKVSAHLREGRLRGVPATPTLYVNGKLVKWPGTEAFEAYVRGL